jgi:hypothetical protein
MRVRHTYNKIPHGKPANSGTMPNFSKEILKLYLLCTTEHRAPPSLPLPVKSARRSEIELDPSSGIL